MLLYSNDLDWHWIYFSIQYHAKVKAHWKFYINYDANGNDIETDDDKDKERYGEVNTNNDEGFFDMKESLKSSSSVEQQTSDRKVDTELDWIIQKFIEESPYHNPRRRRRMWTYGEWSRRTMARISAKSTCLCILMSQSHLYNGVLRMLNMHTCLIMHMSMEGG